MKSVKIALASFVLTIVLGGLAACVGQQDKPSTPLQTKGTTAAPQACEELRKRGGSC